MVQLLEGLRQCMGPPDSTHVTQLLDQINAALHMFYRSGTKEIFNDYDTIDRHGFLDILASIWTKWATKESIIKAARRVGISKEGLNWKWMQVEKLMLQKVKININLSSVMSIISSSGKT